MWSSQSSISCSNCSTWSIKQHKTETLKLISFQFLCVGDRVLSTCVCPCRKLTSIAFNDMNPFPSRLLRNRRVLHLERLQAELRELEEQHKEFITESVVRKDKELDVMVSEDDEDLWSHGTLQLLTSRRRWVFHEFKRILLNRLLTGFLHTKHRIVSGSPSLLTLQGNRRIQI